MKNLCLKALIIFLTCITCNSIAQTTGFAPEGAEWYYEIRHPFDGLVEFGKIEVAGDTIIEDKECRIIIKENGPACYGGAHVEYVYEEDSVVFFYDANYNTFQILYDFTVKSGDFWFIKVPNAFDNSINDSIKVQIDSIDMVTINDKNLKVLYANYMHSDTDNVNAFFEVPIIEKIGTSAYLFIYFDQSIGICDAQYSMGLRCYMDPEFGLYETGLAASCDTTYILSEISEPEIAQQYEVFPNPAHDNIFLNIQDEGCLKYNNQILLFHTTGQLVLQNTDVHCGLNTIQVDYLPVGIYFLHFLHNGQKVYSQKLVIE